VLAACSGERLSVTSTHEFESDTAGIEVGILPADSCLFHDEYSLVQVGPER